MNILLIEDEENFSTLIAGRLRERLGVNVIVARTAEQAFIEIRRIPPPDFIFLDLRLPDSRSNETVASIPKIMELAPESPICVLSGTADEKLIQLSRALGADSFQAKQDMTSQVDLWNAIKRAYSNRIARGFTPSEAAEALLAKVDSLLLAK